MQSQESGKIKILLVEDSATDAEWVQRMALAYSNPAMEVIWAQSLTESRKYLEKEAFDLVITDLQLPDGQGLEIPKLFREIAPSVPIVLLTGALQDESIAIEALKYGAQDYLFKDKLQESELRRVVLHSIERNKLQNKLDLANQALLDMVCLDPLTEVLNRRGFVKEFDSALAEKKRVGLNYCVLLIDFDDFKSINDSYGHGIGDIALKTVTRVLKKAVRKTDKVARVGGDEFLVLLFNAREAEAMVVAEKIRTAIFNTEVGISHDKKIRISVSIGAQMLTEQMLSLDELLQSLHASLKRSKQGGKNQITFQSSGVQEVIEGQKNMNAVYESIKDPSNYFSVFQPIMDLSQNKTVGYEALTRTVIREFDAPVNFFALARAQNLMRLVDQICLNTCVHASKEIPGKELVHINILPSTLADLPKKYLRDNFSKTHAGRQYCVELSEQQIIGDPSYLAESVAYLKEIGCLIAIDDLGFGYTSVESLVVLQPNIVKIDRSAITGIVHERGKQVNLKRLLKIIEACEAKAIAEGIETEDDFRMLKSLGVRYGQGYYFAYPKKIDELFGLNKKKAG